MKRIFLPLLFILIVSINKISAQAGVAINTDGSTADASAMLDVKATNKGVLVPRVTSTASVTSPVNGLLVYQTGGTPGFYYYNGSSWAYLQNSDNANVTLQGNTFNGANQLVKLNASTQLPSVSGINLTALNASSLASGTVPTARLGTGTASSTTFLRGDNTWATPSGGSSSVMEVIASNTASQTVATGNTSTPPVSITFGTLSVSPTIGSWDGTTYTAGATGNYLIVASIATTNLAGLLPSITAGGVTFYGAIGANANVPTPVSRSEVTALVNLTAGSTVVVKVSNSSSSIAGPLTSDGSTRISIMKL